MKAIIESHINYGYVRFTNPATTVEKVFKMNAEFIEILTTIANATAEDLRNEMAKLNLTYFVYGFGGNHMWMKQRDLSRPGMKTADERLLFVEL